MWVLYGSTRLLLNSSIVTVQSFTLLIYYEMHDVVESWMNVITHLLNETE